MNPLIRLVKLYELIAKLRDDEVIIMLAYGQQLLESRPKEAPNANAPAQ